ncbi:hypothetical protein [Legionella spiritensis]|uniref:Uncharacterized protein n=1 Tax=Legionella spiritensis TaxID=452 RepID=A0A0W0YYP1_LEGSP|nr:hypothetical protein [Legionella spiritensis]KTD62026.1 hypothetical protein Lspi_1876 [Legionella spiritensis]SNV34666.1 Uncharacterised protein [Legionella spiritensis]VEG89651.1 Uncharacterised protein [Legionella spiritensis]
MKFFKHTREFIKDYIKDDSANREVTRIFYTQEIKNALSDVKAGQFWRLKDITPGNFHKNTTVDSYFRRP